MSRKPRKKRGAPNSAVTAPSENSTQPFFKRTWVVLGTIASAIFMFLLNATTLLENIRNLPAQIDMTYGQYLQWLYEDTEWTGNWSSYPEGNVDMADLNLTDTEMRITIWASRGRIEGTIATREICKAVPFNFMLLRGEVGWGKANVIVHDIVAGEKKDFAKLKIARTDNVITVVPTDGIKGWFPSEARLGRHPSENGKEPEPDITLCRQVRAELQSNENQH